MGQVIKKSRSKDHLIGFFSLFFFCTVEYSPENQLLSIYIFFLLLTNVTLLTVCRINEVAIDGL
ncbi:hypothetical protein J3Q64DRAFT_1774186 [Phycomyces blakesleeanus]|uniref:Uncharacterized protein n=1 Tax=Phycomyces blakesleeanus TaxID=4837 RepID=A0ABR3AJX7_PHYBL